LPESKVIAINGGKHRERLRARRDALIEEHLSLVEGIARNLAKSLPNCFELDDLIATGNLALTHAATRYRPRAHGGAPFAAYARLVVRGAILDSVRRRNWDEATRPGLEVMRLRSDDAGDFEAEIAEMDRDATRPAHDEAIDAGRLARRLAEAISWLPLEQRRVLRMYYDADEPTLIEVGARLELSTHRTRQLHAAAVEGLRRRFKPAA
jgi:RNA polymerase sigma factor (sigma-70 family)